MRVLLRGDLDPFDGDCLGLVRALLKRGVELHLEPLAVVPPIPADAAVLLTLDRFDAYDLTLHLCEPHQLGLTDPDTAGIKIAWTYATQPGAAALSASDQRLTGYDLIIGYDTGTLPKVTTAPHTAATAVVNGGIWPRDWPAAQRDWTSGHFAFTMIGEYSRDVVEVFRELREQHPQAFEDVELNIKTDLPVPDPIKAPGVAYFDGYFNPDTVADFYADQHILITAATAKNNHALQFLSSGGTVVATMTPSSAQWLSSAIGYPTIYELNRGHHEDRDAFKALILDILTNRDDAERRANRASDLVADLCGWEPVLDRFLTTVADVLPGQGERLLHSARVAQSRAKERSRR